MAKIVAIDLASEEERSPESQLLTFETALVWQKILTEPAVQLKEIMDKAVRSTVIDLSLISLSLSLSLTLSLSNSLSLSLALSNSLSLVPDVQRVRVEVVGGRLGRVLVVPCRRAPHLLRVRKVRGGHQEGTVL